MSEIEQQNRIRQAASAAGWLLWRNNVGALQADNGQWVRYGLANDSAAMNERLKSSDLVGIEPLIITPDMVGRVVGRFVAIEVKRSGWSYRGTGREVAQNRFLELVNGRGGSGRFVSCETIF